MNKPFSLSAAALAATLLLSGCTGGNDQGAAPAPTPPQRSDMGKLPYSNDITGAALSLQEFMTNLDNDMDTSYTGAEVSATNAAAKYELLKTQLPTATTRIDSSLSPEDGVKVLETYGQYLKLVPAGHDFTVSIDELSVDESGKVTVPSSNLRVSFDNKPRVIDRTGESQFVMVYDGSVWKIADANVVWQMPVPQ